MSDDFSQLFDHPNVTRTASAEEISAVEAAIGAMPPSYKTFAETFGYGTVKQRAKVTRFRAETAFKSFHLVVIQSG